MRTMHVFLTRPSGRNDALLRRLSDQGARALELPALELLPLQVPPVLPVPADYDMLVFVSAYAARCYLECLNKAKLTWSDTTWAATVGPSSARALLSSGMVPPDRIVHPSMAAVSQDSENLLATLDEQGVVLHRVLIVRGASGREWLADTLRARGIMVEVLPLYERVPATWSTAQISTLGIALQGPQDCIFVVTSGEGVTALAAKFEEMELRQVWARCRFLTIHPRIATTIQSVLDLPPGSPPPRIDLCAPDDESIFEGIMTALRCG